MEFLRQVLPTKSKARHAFAEWLDDHAWGIAIPAAVFDNGRACMKTLLVVKSAAQFHIT
jgi:hypothetical protein